jgi:hypothetical protein
MRSWRHSGFNVDRSVRLQAGDRDGVERLAQYMARSPFSLARLVRITPAGKVLYKAEKDHCQRYPQPASRDLFGGVPRNYQLFQPLDFLAELIQHIPNKGEHLIRYYGYYSNKARGLRARNVGQGRAQRDLPSPAAPNSPDDKGWQRSATLNRRRWAVLIKHIYQADPLLCPKCGGHMKIIAFIEAHQGDVIRRILEHCGLWHDPPPRSPPRTPLVSRATVSTPVPEADPGITHEVDPDFLEHIRREESEQLELPWDD